MEDKDSVLHLHPIRIPDAAVPHERCARKVVQPVGGWGRNLRSGGRDQQGAALVTAGAHGSEQRAAGRLRRRRVRALRVLFHMPSCNLPIGQRLPAPSEPINRQNPFCC